VPLSDGNNQGVIQNKKLYKFCKNSNRVRYRSRQSIQLTARLFIQRVFMVLLGVRSHFCDPLERVHKVSPPALPDAPFTVC
jgi:hypothetical protein